MISSATINAETFSNYFNNCPIVNIKTPIHPVKLIYWPLIPDNDPKKFIWTIAKALVEINKLATSGDVLIFLSGERDIRACLKQLSTIPESKNWILLPLFGRLSKSEQLRVFQKYQNHRKIIAATNIAETILDLIQNQVSSNSNQETQIYHFSNVGQCSWYDFAYEIIKLAKIECYINPITTKQLTSLAIRPKNSSMSKRKITKEFGMHISHWKTSLIRCVNNL